MNKFTLLSSSSSLDGLKQSISKWFCNEKFELKNRSYNDTIVIYKNDTCLEHYRIIFKNSRYRFEMEVKWKTPNISLSIAYSPEPTKAAKCFLLWILEKYPCCLKVEPLDKRQTSINFRLSNIITRKGVKKYEHNTIRKRNS